MTALSNTSQFTLTDSDIIKNDMLKNIDIGCDLVERIKNISYLNDDAYEFMESVISGVHRSAIVYGHSGMGKTHAVINALRDNKLEEGVDYALIRSHTTPLMLYVWLYLMREEGKFIVLDDCDGVLQNENGLNLIKAATDNNLRQISWFTSSQLFNPLNKEPLPDSFEFKGSLIITTNITPSVGKGRQASHMDAIRSRAVQFSFDMSEKENQLAQIFYMVAFKDYLSNSEDSNITKEEKIELLRFFKANYMKARRLDLRLPQIIAREIKNKKENWERRSLRFLEAA